MSSSSLISASPPPKPVTQSVSSVRARPINIAEYEAYARTHLQKQVYDYYRSGATDEQTLKENCAAYSRILILPRFLIDVSRVSLRTKILGSEIASPICVAPTAMQRMANHEGELASARAAASLNTCFCLSSLSTTNLVKLADGLKQAGYESSLRWFQLYIYRDRKVTLDLVRKAESSGYSAIVLTIDTPFIGTREADVRNGFALPPHLNLANFEREKEATEIITDKGTGVSGLAEYSMSLFDRTLIWSDISWLRSVTSLPIVIKGVLSPEDAILAAEAGAAAIVVSNHGARQVDTVPSTIEALPAIMHSLRRHSIGRAIEVYIDGGIRRGTDVFKALALGARAVFVGRPVLYGLAYAGEQGVRDVLQILNKELELTMGLCGTPYVESITPQFLTTRKMLKSQLNRAIEETYVEEKRAKL